jgi:serine phosphatase RsbU (regulator of sigma subunit)/uncharacterized protein YigA (DUF484 family)
MMTVARDPIATLDEALAAIAERAAAVTDADVVVVRLAEESGGFVAHAVHARSEALRAELEGSRIAEAPFEERVGDEELPVPLEQAAERLAAVGVLQLPVLDERGVVGSLELLRSRDPFDERELEAARAAAGEVELACRAFAPASASRPPDPLELAGDALAAGADEARAAEQVAALAAEATGADASLIWRYGDGDQGPAASAGASVPAGALDSLARARRSREPLALDGRVVTLQLGEPPIGALQLVFSEPPDAGLLEGLATFSVRAAHALRSSERRRELAAELERTRALLSIVGQAIAELSLAHTLETAVDRVHELFGADQLAIYLVDDAGRLETASDLGLTGPHARGGARRRAGARGRGRPHGLVHFADGAADPRLAGVRDALEELGLEAALGVPLRAGEETIGLLAVYLQRGWSPTENEESLLRALADQLAAAVQNARLHERTKQLGAEREAALDAERKVARRLSGLYEISRSFSESLSLEATLEAVTRTIAEQLELDAAALRLPNERGDALVPVAVHVREDRLAEPVSRILSLSQPLSGPGPGVFRSGEPLVLDPARAAALGPAHEALIPFLEKGSTAAVIPLTAHDEVLGTMTLLSLDPDRPVTGDTLEAALSLAAPAALAVENARLHQEHERFTETMRLSLLPRTRPQLAQLQIGDHYEPSTRVEIGGDVYDFLELAEGRLAVVLGDVTGHGIDAAADMAMAKYVFRSLARDHPEPGDFLAAANEIVLGEITPGKFVTMLYLVADAATGELACASAGHPPPRLVAPGRAPQTLSTTGLALGIEGGQSYGTARVVLEPGASAVLFTDGLLEARREGELFGDDRLDGALARHAELPAPELARALAEDCRAFAGELGDDLAVVVLKRPS